MSHLRQHTSGRQVLCLASDGRASQRTTLLVLQIQGRLFLRTSLTLPLPSHRASDTLFFLSLLHTISAPRETTKNCRICRGAVPLEGQVCSRQVGSLAAGGTPLRQHGSRGEAGRLAAGIVMWGAALRHCVAASTTEPPHALRCAGSGGPPGGWRPTFISCRFGWA